MSVPCQNTPEYVLHSVDPETETMLPEKFACPIHVGDVARRCMAEYSIHGAFVCPMEESDGQEKCEYLTPEEIASILESKKRILEALEKRHELE